MINQNFAERFARDWAASWNDRDLDAIMAHYADSIIFHSPRIKTVLSVERATIEGKAALRDYWETALEAAPELYFEIDTVLVSSDALTVLYTNHRDQQVAETFVFDERLRVSRSIAAYG